MPRIGLVLGAGGAVGYAFHAGVLAAISDATGWDAREAEIIVGTSAGSIVGASFRGGLGGIDLAARECDMPLSEAGRRLVDRADAATKDLPPIPDRAPKRRGVPVMSAPGALARAAIPPWTARPGALAAAALPVGSVSTETIAGGFRPFFDDWPQEPLWLNAVQLDSSRRVTFGQQGAPETDVASAVAASCAIPTFFAPVNIDGVRYVDGGVHSPTNADLLAGLDLDLVVISSPMSIARAALRFAPDQATRRIARFALAREVNRIRRSGTAVITFQPTNDDLGAMGLNAMDPTRREQVTRRIRESATQRLGLEAAHDRVAILVGAGLTGRTA